MRDEHDRAVERGVQLLEQLDDLRLDGHVERRGRLVGDQHVGLAQQRHGDHDALAHAAAELMRIGGQPRRGIGDADARQHRRGALAQLPAAEIGMAVALRVDQLRAEREHRIERRHRVLEDHRDAGAAQPPHVVGRQRQQVLAVERDAARDAEVFAGSRPSSARASVDLPLPLSPTMPTTRRLPIDRLTSRSAWTAPFAVAKSTDRFSISTSAVRHGSRLSLGSIASRSALAEQREAERGERQHAAGDQHRPDRLVEIGEAVEQHRAPAGERRADADAEEAQAGLQRDDDRDVHAGQHDDRPDDVGQDVEQHDARARRAERALGFEEGPLLDGQRLRARDAAELRHEDDGDEDDDVDQPRPEHRHQRQRQDQARERADDVEQREDGALDRRRRIGGGDAEQQCRAPAPSPSPPAPRRWRSWCRTGRARTGRGRDGRCRASGWPTAATCGRRRRSGSACAWRSAAPPARRSPRSAWRSGRAGRSGCARCGGGHRASGAAPGAGAAEIFADARIEPGIGQVDQQIGQRRRSRRRPECRPARSDSCGCGWRRRSASRGPAG